VQPSHTFWDSGDESLRHGGIYHITHVPTGREYIGSAKCLRERWGEHLDQLRHHRHHNYLLRRSWHVHGETEFVFAVLEFVDQYEDLIPREQWYIDTRHPYYNLAPIAGSMLGYRHRSHSRRQMSESARRQRANPTPAQLDYYARLHIPSPRVQEWHRRQPGLPKKQPLTPLQIAALRRGAFAKKPIKPENMAAHMAKWAKAHEARKGATNTPQHRRHISLSCKASFAAFPPEKQKRLKEQAKANALTHAKRRHEEGLANQQLVWEVMERLGWIPNVPHNSWAAAKIVQEYVPHLSQSRISEFLRWWATGGKITLSTERKKPEMSEKSLVAHHANITRAQEIRMQRYHERQLAKRD
jgi:group I intron endonuclease